MERERNKQIGNRRRRRLAAAIVVLVLSSASCGRGDEGPLPPHSPPRPTTAFGLELIHAHYHLPARPVPPRPGMM